MKQTDKILAQSKQNKGTSWVPLLLLYILSISTISSKGQNSKADSLRKSPLTFEEKQKRDLSNKKNETGMYYARPVFDFSIAAKKVTKGVVHIKSSYSGNGTKLSYPFNDDFWYKFFSDENSPIPHTDASGVIVSSDGYIVTNDHVIDNAEKIEVILQNQKSYAAKIVGLDPETDIALLKIEEKNLTFIEFGNSDEVQVGDWVLAVGNPFNLTSTVTAGIVSAKARNINLLKARGSIESYIQTDAAMNPGNSGGALVNYNGKLIGINSAIATPTGSYAGYSFAIPVNIVKKVINDLLINGKVKRGYLGVIIKDMSSEEAKQLNTDIANGVYIDSLIEGGAALKTDLKQFDIITAIDGFEITTSGELQEIMEQHRPGEKLLLTILRKGTEKKIPIILSESEGNIPGLSGIKSELALKLGIILDQLSKKDKKQLRISSGVKVIDVYKGKLYYKTNIKKGFIITRVNGKPVNTDDDFLKAFFNGKTIITLEGIYPDLSGTFYYAFGIE